MSLVKNIQKFKLVASEMRSFKMLAEAINDFKTIHFTKKYNNFKWFIPCFHVHISQEDH